QARAWVALDRMIKVGEAQGIAKEEYRRVVTDDVPVAFLGVKFQREATDIAFRIGRASFAGDGGESRKHRRLLADLRENLCFGVAAYIVRHRECAIGSPALGVHAPLRNNLAV